MVSRAEFAESVNENITELESAVKDLKALKKAVENKKTNLAEFALAGGEAFLGAGKKVKSVSDKLFNLSEEVDEIA